MFWKAPGLTVNVSNLVLAVTYNVLWTCCFFEQNTTRDQEEIASISNLPESLLLRVIPVEYLLRVIDRGLSSSLATVKGALVTYAEALIKESKNIPSSTALQLSIHTVNVSPACCLNVCFVSSRPPSASLSVYFVSVSRHPRSTASFTSSMSLLEGAFGTNIYGGTFTIHGVASSPASIALKELSSRAAHSAFHDSAARFDKPRCHPNTRKTILDRLERWMRDLSDQELSLLWLYGGAGAGKSAIMQSIVERCVHHRVVLGTFFFYYADESRNNAEALIPTIAYQVATTFPSALDILGPVITNNPLVLKASLETQALMLLVGPLQHLAAIGQLRADDSFPHVFVIDGLDECQNPEKQAAIIRIIADILHDHRLCVKFIIASRPEVAIKQAFLNDPRLEVSFDSIFLDDSAEAASDIRKYIEDTFADIVRTHPLKKHITLPWPTPSEIHSLVAKSSGHFIFASTAMEYIASSKEHPPRALKVILGLEKARQGQPFAQLDALYTFILTSAAYPSEALSILTYYSILIHTSVSVTEASAVLEYTPEDIPLFLSDVVSIVSLDDGDHIKFRHASLRDFLKDKSRSRHLCASPEYHVERATRLILRIQTCMELFSPECADLVFIGLLAHLSSVLESPAHTIAIQEQLWKVSAQDLHEFLKEYGRRGPGAIYSIIPSQYMNLVLQYAEHGDTSLYVHHFKIYLALFIDCALSRKCKVPDQAEGPLGRLSGGIRSLRILQDPIWRCKLVRQNKIFPV